MVHPQIRIHVREADRLDVPALTELRVAALLEMGILELSEAPAFRCRALAELWALVSTGAASAWLMFDGDGAIGCAAIVYWNRLPYPGSSLHAELAGVYVVPAHRRRGYAAELVAEALAGARGRGVRRIVLQPTNATRAFYRSFGFDESGQMRL